MPGADEARSVTFILQCRRRDCRCCAEIEQAVRCGGFDPRKVTFTSHLSSAIHQLERPYFVLVHQNGDGFHTYMRETIAHYGHPDRRPFKLLVLNPPQGPGRPRFVSYGPWIDAILFERRDSAAPTTECMELLYKLQAS